MVHTGKPSRACKPCKDRHLKCDESRPSCYACVKAGITCTGYKDEFEIVLRDQTAFTVERATRRKPAVSRSSRARQKPSTSAETTPSSSPREDDLRVLRSITEDPEMLALTMFFTQYCMLDRDPQGDPGYTGVLPGFYSRTPSDSALALAATAQALTVFGRRPEAMHMPWKKAAMQKYSQALISLNDDLRDPVKSKTDDTMLAVLVLSFYERANVPSAGNANTQLSHQNGAASLVRLRGSDSFTDGRSQRLLWVLRANFMNGYLSSVPGTAINDEGVWTDPKQGMMETYSTRLIRIASELRFIRAMVTNEMGEICTDELVLHDAIDHAWKVDVKLLEWADAIPNDWRGVSADIIPESVRIEGIYGQCLVFSNLYSSNTWARYHMARIALQVLIQRCLDQLQITRSPTLDTSCSIVQEQADAICHIVPFYLGSRSASLIPADQPVIEFPRRRDRIFLETTRQSLVNLGQYYMLGISHNLMANVTALSGKPVVRPGQMQWIRTQIYRCIGRPNPRALHRNDSLF